MDARWPLVHRSLHMHFLGAKVEEVPGRGRGVVASRRLSPGHVLLTEPALAAVPAGTPCPATWCGVRAPAPSNVPVTNTHGTTIVADQQDRVCHACFSVALIPRTSRCSACRVAFYCNRACQRTHWPVHRPACKGFQRVGRVDVPLFIQLIAQVMHKLAPESAETRAQVLGLHAGPDVSRQADMDAKRDLIPLIVAFTGQQVSQSFGLKQVYRLLLIDVANTFTISDPDECTSIGAGWYINGSMLNHDCVPNCVTMFQGSTLIVRVIRPVQQGQELCHAYLDLYTTRRARHSILQHNYAFSCVCTRCSCAGSDPNLDAELEPCPTDAGKAELADRLFAAAEQQDSASSEAVDMAKQALEMYAQAGIVPPAEKAIKCANKLLHLCFETQDWATGAQACRATLPAYRRVYGAGHPLYGLQLLRMARMCALCDALELARDHFQRAIDVLATTHGASHALVLDAKEQQMKLIMDMQNPVHLQV